MKKSAIKQYIAIFTDKYIEVSYDVPRNLQLIGKRWHAGDVIYRPQEIERLLEVGAPIDLYLKVEQIESDVNRTAKSGSP